MKLNYKGPLTLTYANLVLLALLLFTIFFVMMFPPVVQRILYQCCLTGIMAAAFLCVDKKHRRYMQWFFGLSIILLWANFLTTNLVLNGISKVLAICLYLIVAIRLVQQAASSKTVNPLVILQSVNGYLMIAMFYAIIIALIMLVDPGAYHFVSAVKNTDEILINFNQYLYYGFNAFTTVTYGDVMPVSPAAKSVSMAMGFTGQMYVAIIIAMLVGKFASQSREK